MQPALDLSLVIPCYRDAPHLAWAIGEVIQTMKHTTWSWEIILVNDASPDDCGKIIEELIQQHSGYRLRSLHHEKNTGRGRAVMDGIAMAAGRYVGFIDIDLEVHSRYIPSMIEALEQGADVAVAHRHYNIGPQVIHRAIMSKGYIWLMNHLLGFHMKDTEAGYKFFRADSIAPVLAETHDPGWFFDTEIMARAHLAGLKLAFVPTLFLRRPDKASTVRLFTDSIAYIKNLLAFRKQMREKGKLG
jgi:glycosyltransferase involved in cell wall biosynthesis